MKVLHWIETITLIYLVGGFLFSLRFLFTLVNRMDERMQDASFPMRLLLLPGTIILWPWLWDRFRKSKSTNP
ncbi:MAG TPA: hypothetical protein PK066_20930 [Saprospiraceae bacterium]|nr:hypothetical protein [Saprospiraceae bacterium]